MAFPQFAPADADLLARIEKALAASVREALMRHKREGNPVATWRDGQVVWVDPDDIPVDRS